MRRICLNRHGPLHSRGVLFKCPCMDPDLLGSRVRIDHVYTEHHAAKQCKEKALSPAKDFFRKILFADISMWFKQV